MDLESDARASRDGGRGDGLSPAESFFVAGEYAMGVGAIVASILLVATDTITAGQWLCFCAGVFIGSIWENVHAVIGDECLRLVNPAIHRYIPRWVYPFLHAVADGLVMVSGLALAWLFFRYAVDKSADAAWARLTTYDPFALLFLLAFGLLQELAVELAFNGRVWRYEVTATNPALFWIGDVGYTIWPFLEWVLASVVFWALSAYLLPLNRICSGPAFRTCA